MARNATRRVINNAPYYNDSLAYDFDMFMPKKPKSNNVIEYKPKKKVSAKPKYKIDGLSVLLVVGIFATMMYSLFLRVSICESDHAIKGLEKTVLELQSEQSQLNFEYQSKMSYPNLEQKATELGMRKMTKDQIVYIHTNEADKAVLQDGRVEIVGKD